MTTQTNSGGRVEQALGDPNFLSSLEWRSIGPFRGGRSVAVAGCPSDPMTFYFGGSGSGVWKTHDGGVYWRCVSDGYFNTGPVGAIAVAPSDPNVIYAGTGEACPRPDVSHGDGVYKSTDGGQTWRNMGLKATRHIARIRIHPRNPDIVYVAAMGHLFGTNPERGVYRSTNGGASWELVLHVSEEAGAVDLSMDPNNPRVIYASIFHFLRQPWDEISGGPHSGLHKTTDGGDTWTDLTSNPGLPKGIKGRIGVALSPARPERVWALVEAEDGALFRSENGGMSWEVATDKRDLRRSASSYHHIFAHPQDPDTLYALSYTMWKSTDAGRTFEPQAMPHGDHHDLWLDPNNPQRMIQGNDGGATVTFNGGASWSSIYNQPTHSFFHLATDTRFPYRVYGTPMDNTAVTAPSRTFEAGIPWKDCYPVGSAESGHIVVLPDDPDIVIAGSIGSSPGGGGNLLRYNHKTGQSRLITVWPEDQYGSPLKDVKHRFHFTYPVTLSPHDDTTLYVAANRVFRSTNQGASWDCVSPDLTAQDESKMGYVTGGPITSGGMSSQYSSVIYAFAESRLEQGVLWAGTDHGAVHLSKDGGGTWREVSPPGLPEWTCISIIEPSPHDAGTVYVAAHRFKLADLRPFILKTTDYGETWQEITDDIRPDDVTRVVREDPARPGLLYAGTETGVYVSANGGEAWHPLSLNLPAVAVHDMQVKENDLVAATHGRAFWVLDNLTPLHQLSEAALASPAHLFRPPDTHRVNRPLRWSSPTQPGKNYDWASGTVITYNAAADASGRMRRQSLDNGANPPFGVPVTYYLSQDVNPNQVTITILEDGGREIRSFTGADVTAGAGMNRFVWDLRYPTAKPLSVPSALTPQENGSPMAPLAAPGAYRVRLSVGNRVITQAFQVLKDPRIEASEKDLMDQFDLHRRIIDLITALNGAADGARAIGAQVAGWAERSAGSLGGDQVARAAEGLRRKLAAIEDQITRRLGANTLMLPPKTLDVKLAALTSVVGTADFAPTAQAYEVFDHLSGLAGKTLAEYRAIVAADLPEFLSLVEEVGAPLIAP